MINGKHVIWFNTWFSAIINSMRSIKDSFENIHIIATNKSKDCVYASVADEFYVEDDVDSYVDYALSFCKKHNVDIFFPKHHVNEIALRERDFSDIGVTLVCESSEILGKFNSKNEVYEELKRLGYTHIPEYWIATRTSEYLNAYHKITDDMHCTACIKFDMDEGATSFRMVTDAFKHYGALSEPFENTLTNESLIDILAEYERKSKDGSFRSLMVMPKLLSPEVSVDCYMAANGEFVAMPRFKLGSRIKEIRLNKDLIDDSRILYDIYKFRYGFNVQYRWTEDGEFKLLEINPRISGGIHLSSMAGYNIPVQIIGDILGIETNQSIGNIKDTKVTQYETPVII